MDRNKKMALVYPGHVFDPESLLIFTETTWFTRDWNGLGLNAEGDLATLQLSIMCDPKGPPVVQGTGGLRKLRFSPPSWDMGKRGALRIGYVHYEEFGNALLVAVYPKGVKDNLTAQERREYKAFIKHQKQRLSEQYFT